MKTVDEILAQLQQRSSEKYKKNVVRMGIPERFSLGVPTPEIRKLAKSIGNSHELALELWDTEYHEARLLSILLMDVNEINFSFVEKLMNEVISWDLCDHICKNLIINLPNYEEVIFQWCNENRMYFKRAAYCLISTSLIKFKNIDEEKIDTYLELIKQHSADSRMHVKKAISWALREIGKMNHTTHEKAILTAYDLCEQSDKNKNWVGKTAQKELSELVSISERKRLISSKTKMGKLGT